MIQELFGGGAAGLLGGEGKISAKSPALPPSSAVANGTPPASSAIPGQNLRCPRCDSSNTKFCYYNNYNLTQPRHFCKTCRRYWTKGGALRNVPIGGGCRKNKTTAFATAGKLLKTPASDAGKPALFNGFDYELSLNPLLWPSPPQSSQLLALLRSTPNPNPNPSPIPCPNSNGGFASNSVTVRDPGFVVGSERGFDPAGQVWSVTPGNSLWKSNQNHTLGQLQHLGFVFGDIQNNGIPSQQYQRLSSSSTHCRDIDQAPVLLGNAFSSSLSTVLESAPVAGGEMDFWIPTLSSWPDLPTTHGANP